MIINLVICLNKLTNYHKNRIKGYFIKFNNMEKLSHRVGDQSKISKKHKIHFLYKGKPKCNLRRYKITTLESTEVTCGLCLKSMG